ncbi:sigma factor [Lentzea sp. NPDC060358]|uniref:sigma factor n=1 Tax=Lentzea sp. NPDC060358 TaxID=3347103 RepID=UPI003669286E
MSLRAGEQEGLDDLLLRVAGRDEEAFGRLYDSVGASVFGLVRRVVSDQARTEAVFQEVMLEVWRTAGGFDPRRARAATWILATTHRYAVERARPLPLGGALAS